MICLSAEQRQFIVDLYRDGAHTQTMIAELIGTTQSNVSKVLAQARRHDPQIPGRRAARGRLPRRKAFAASQLGSFAEPANLDFM